jgi:tetratricopeptide (TPR) repeat protein
MRIAIVCFALLVNMFSASAENPDTMTKENAIEAFREYRTGVKLISGIHTDLMQTSITADPADEIEIPKERIEDYKLARKHLEKSVTLNPYFPEAYVFLANSYWEIENDLQKTVEYYSRALEIDPDYDDVISARGQVFVILNRVEDAEKDLERLEALDSDHAPPLRKQIAELKTNSEQGVAPQSATRSESDSEGGDKPQPESEARSR